MDIQSELATMFALAHFSLVIKGTEQEASAALQALGIAVFAFATTRRMPGLVAATATGTRAQFASWFALDADTRNPAPGSLLAYNERSEPETLAEY
jgi:hypothetical protein